MMFFKGLITLSILLGLQLSAYAEPYRYEMTIPNAVGIFGQNLYFDYDPSCQVEVDESLTHMNEYLDIAGSGTKRKARKALEKIKSIEEQNQKSKCADTIFEMNTILAAISLHGGISQDDHKMMNFFLAYIQRKHIIKPLGEAIRVQHAILNDPKIMGAYYCAEDVIWLDTKNSPLNRAGILMHELQHWSMAHLKASQDLNLKGRSAYLFEEFISAVNPAMTQVALKSNANRNKDENLSSHTRFHIGAGGIGWSTPKTYYRTKHDLNLYSQKGVLSKSWRQIIQDKGIKRDSGYRNFLLNDFLNIELGKKSSALSVLQMIEEVYFGKASSQSVDVYNYIKANKGFLKKYINPLEQIVFQESDGWNDMGPTKWDSLGKPFCDGGTTPYPGGEGGSMSLDVKLMRSPIKACLTPHKDL